MTQFGDAYGSSPTKKNGQLLFKVVLIAISVILLALAIFTSVGYLDQKSNVDSKINIAVATAKKTQADADEAKFAEREKEPNLEFIGPEDYGRVTFDYPKTWSLYVAKDASTGGNYEAYLNPKSVPSVSSTQQYALRVTIEQTDYDQVISKYAALVKKGDLTSSTVTVNDINGSRLDGSFSKDIRGSQVIFKIRDKTLTIRTDANTFKADFDALISTIRFNQ